MGTQPNQEVWDRKDKEIISQNVLNRAVDMFCAGKIEFNEVFQYAEDFYNWVRSEPGQRTVKGVDNSAHSIPMPDNQGLSVTRNIKDIPLPTQGQKKFIDKIQGKYEFTLNEIYMVNESFPNNMDDVVSICAALKKA